nr:hypothetical protein [Tanacetum cinerariifolium]
MQLVPKTALICLTKRTMFHGRLVFSADDQAIQTILLGLPEDIYVAVDSCEAAQEIWLRIQQMMKGSDIGIQKKKANNLKFLNNLQPEWSRHVTIVHQTKDLHTADYTQLYDFLKYNQNEVDDLKAERFARTQDPLALMETSCNPYTFPVLHQDQPSFNQNYMQQPIPNPKDITNPTTAMNMELALMAKAFKLNYTTPTNNNQMLSSNPRNRQIVQPGNVNGYNDVQNVKNQVIQNAVQNPRIQNVRNQNGLTVVSGNANQNPNGNGNLVAARDEGNATGHNGNQIRCYNCRGVDHFARNYTVRPRRRDAAYLQTRLLIAQKEEVGIQLQAEEFDLMATVADLDEIEEVNANCILMANLQQTSTSGTQTDKAPVYDSDGSAKYTEILEPIPEPYQVPQNDNNVISKVTSVEQSGGTVEQHPTNVEETRVLYDSLYHNLAIEVEKVNTQCLISVNHDVCSLKYVNGMTSRGKKQKANVSINENQKKQNPKVKKPKKIGSIERLASPKPSKLRSVLRWSPTGRLFDLKGKIIASSESESQFDCSKGDNACTSNPLEPTIKRFPNSTFSLAAIATAYFTQNRSIIHRRFNKTPYDLINRRKPDISFLHVFGALCYPKSDPGDIGKLGAKGDIGYFIGYSADSCAFKVYNRRTKKIMETMNVSFDELSTMAFEQSNLKPGLQSMTSGQISSGLDLTYASSTITTQQPTEGELDLLFEAIASHPPKPVPNSRQRLHLLHMDLCGPMRMASINGKRYVLVIVDDYSRYTWVHFLRSKDKAPEVIIKHLKRITVLLQSPVIIIRSDNGKEFKNQVLKVYFDSVGITHQMSSIRTPQQNGVAERRNQTLVEAARTIKPDISFLHVFGALCYPKNDREDIGKLGAKGDIGFFIGYSADSYAYRVYNRRSKKIMETMNVSFDELSAMAFEQRSSKPGLQCMTSGQISSGLDLTYAPSTITTQQPTEGELDFLFEAMYDDYFGGQPSATVENVPPVQEPQVRQTSTASTITTQQPTEDTAPTPTISSSQATNFPNPLQDVDGLISPQQHAQQQGNQASLQSKTVADNVPNAMFDANTFVNPFATLSTSAAESSSSQYVDPSNMHTFYQPYPHEFQWTKDH